jgi:hypothetical protein
MRLLAAIMVLVLAHSPATPADAGPRDRQYQQRKSIKPSRGRGETAHRSSTVDRNGLCQRDNGRSWNSLDLNHQCDREEFWARFNDYGDNQR